MISLGVLSSARTASEEFAGGLINLATWPMMFLSGVWFSLEGSPKIIIKLSQMLPLTHLIEAARGIMNEGKTLADVSGHVIVLAVMTLVFLFAGSLIFRWNQE
jgi:ABC-type multidrug transport system permease subunit